MKSSALHELTDPHAAAHTRSADAHLLVVGEIGRELAAPRDIELRLARALQALDDHLGALRSVLYVTAEGDRPGLSVVAVHGIDAEQFKPRPGQGVAGRVAHSGQPVVVPVVRHDAMAQSELSDLSLWHDADWNLVAVPVGSGARPLGALCVYFRHRDGAAERASGLELVAALLAKAIDASRLSPRLFEEPPRRDELARASRAGATPTPQEPFDRSRQTPFG